MLQPFMFQEACHLGQWGFMPGIQLFLKLCLGTCWDPLSIRNGVGVESIRHSFLYIPQQYSIQQAVFQQRALVDFLGVKGGWGQSL